MQIHEILRSLKGKRVAIDDVVTSYSRKKDSHKSSWPHLLKCQLSGLGVKADVLSKDSDVHGYDVWLISLPMEFQGTFNLFGGATEEVAARIRRLSDFKGKVFILNHDMPDIGAFVQSRMKSACDSWKDLDPKKYTEISRSIQRVDLVLKSDTFVYGDSHSVSVYVPGANISRNDGQTLHGFLKKRDEFSFPEGTKNIVFYMGNIDVRHHIFRQPEPISSLTFLLNEYMDFVQQLREDRGIEKVTLVSLLPVEHEERRIPKTGWYKGTPFYGSLKDRRSAVKMFNSALEMCADEFGYDVIHWPDEWYDMDPKKYADTCMERPGSVHLSREFYQYDFDTVKKNERMSVRHSALF